MQQHMPDLWFRLMAFEYRFKPSASAVLDRLKEAGIRPGTEVLDYGCGPGRYTIPAAKLTGSSGTVHAVDAHPMTIAMVERSAAKAGLTNIRAVNSDCATGLPPDSIDVMLLYDTLHDVADQQAVLTELHRVLKPGGN